MMRFLEKHIRHLPAIWGWAVVADPNGAPKDQTVSFDIFYRKVVASYLPSEMLDLPLGALVGWSCKAAGARLVFIKCLKQ